LGSGIGITLRNQSQELDRLLKGLKDPRKRVAETWMRLDEIYSRLLRLIDVTLSQGKRRLSTEGRGLLLHSPLNIMTSMRQRVDFQKRSLGQGINRRLREKQMGLALLEKRIEDLSPLSILKRGYSITRKLPGKTLLKAAAGAQKGDQVQVLLAEGELECQVEKVRIDRKW
jgi:exodeoxyribonuclease VII large subunit